MRASLRVCCCLMAVSAIASRHAECSIGCSADGSLLDVTLLAAVAALSTLRLPAVRVNEDGNVVPADEADDDDDGNMESDAAANEALEPADRCGSREVSRQYCNHAQQYFAGCQLWLRLRFPTCWVRMRVPETLHGACPNRQICRAMRTAHCALRTQCSSGYLMRLCQRCQNIGTPCQVVRRSYRAYLLSSRSILHVWLLPKSCQVLSLSVCVGCFPVTLMSPAGH